MADTTENPNEETLKCVVVGDNNVGKTRLICARVYNEVGPNQRCRAHTSHVPTVWAIDQYRNNKQVLQNARCVIDGTAVSLRLWDTFGDHHKNRMFAYGKADIVVICFSICDEKSLRHVVTFWEPEVRKHCKNIPIILVGCKADMRFADLVKLNKEKGSLSKAIRQTDILFPEKCRAVAQQLSCPYYEASVLLGYGVRHVFENVCRAALIYRRTLYFWNSKLKRITRPVLQEPLMPPKPDPPEVSDEAASLPLPNLIELYRNEALTDVVFMCQGKRVGVHKVILSASSDVFFNMFLHEEHEAASTSSIEDDLNFLSPTVCHVCKQTQNVQGSSSKDDNVILNFCSGGMRLIEDVHRGQDLCNGVDNKPAINCNCQYTLPDGVVYCGRDNTNSPVYSLDCSIDMCQIVMDFCYTGTTSYCLNNQQSEEKMRQVLALSQCFGLPFLHKLITAFKDEDLEYSDAITQQYLCTRSKNMRRLFIEEQYFADVVFRVDDGCVYGHKLLLASGSDMMNAMFAGHFVESANKEVPLPQTNTDILEMVFEFLYLNTMQEFDDCVVVCDLLALANRLCLQNLVSYLERMAMRMFQHKEEEFTKTGDKKLVQNLCEDAVVILRTSEVHNAPELSKWSLHFLSVHYNDACRYAPKFLKSLPPSVQSCIEEHRWPPVWYIKQRDYYDRAVFERAGTEGKKGKK